MLMKKVNKASIQRTQLMKLFVDRDLSPRVQLAISEPFKDLTDPEKEELAARMISIINSCETEQEILSKL